MAGLSAHSLSGLPEVRRGDDLAALIVGALDPQRPLRDRAIVALAHKVVSKAEGAVVALAGVEPSPRARELAGNPGGRDQGTDQSRDPRAVQVVLDQSTEILRAVNGVLICRTHHGFVCANAGVDASNTARVGSESNTAGVDGESNTAGVDGESNAAGVDGESNVAGVGDESDTVIVLPTDPDASARHLRKRLRELTGVEVAVLITDSFGRAWRHGQCDVAIGCAGLTPLDDWRGRTDGSGRELNATWLAVADAIAATADLARAKDSREPVVVLDGLERFVTPEDGPGAAALLRSLAEDFFR
jgi:coenzyme F420-0:L-glutamate ligase/coenzyme F420-1:gamma-L-glutamate ligase